MKEIAKIEPESIQELQESVEAKEAGAPGTFGSENEVNTDLSESTSLYEQGIRQTEQELVRVRNEAGLSVSKETPHSIKTSKSNLTKKLFSIAQSVGLAGSFMGTEQALAQQRKHPHGREKSKIERESPKSEKVTHRNGDVYEWPGRVQYGDYLPTGKNSFFEKGPEQAKGAGGGFKFELKIMNDSGTLSEKTESKDIDELVSRYSSEISIALGGTVSDTESARKKLISALKEDLKDRQVFLIYQDFLQSGGSIVGVPNWKGGHYTSPEEGVTQQISPDTKVSTGHSLGIEIGLDSDEERMESILYHESLHYMFDKTDSVLWESKGGGGLDHHVIDPLESRFKIINLVRKGKVPLGEGTGPLDHAFTNLGELSPAIKEAIDKNDPTALEKWAGSDKFYLAFVQSAMITPLSSRQVARSHPETGTSISDDQLMDIGYLNAYNAGISQQIFRLAAAVSRKTGVSLQDSFSRPEYQKSFDEFIVEFSQAQDKNVKQPPKQTAFAVMDKQIRELR